MSPKKLEHFIMKIKKPLIPSLLQESQISYPQILTSLEPKIPDTDNN